MEAAIPIKDDGGPPSPRKGAFLWCRIPAKHPSVDAMAGNPPRPSGTGAASKRRVIDLLFLIYRLEDPFFLPIPAPLRRIRAPIDVTLVGPPEFVYFPAPPEFLIGARTRQDVVVDIRPFLRRRHGHFLEDRIVGIDDAGRTILTASGARHGNGALFLGTGPTFRKDTTPGTREFIC